jgi:hypothetical protein
MEGLNDFSTIQSYKDVESPSAQQIACMHKWRTSWVYNSIVLLKQNVQFLGDFRITFTEFTYDNH